MANPELIVMLTHNDLTVSNAAEVFEQCKSSQAHYWGFKEEPLPLPQMKDLFSSMKKHGKQTGLEVVAYTERECVAGAQMAVECGCDMLLGTLFFDSVNEFCRKHGLKYLPFVGTVTQRPSILDGSLDEMVAEAEKYLEKGAYGIDLLGYRYTGDATSLNRAFCERVDAPVCIAGSVNSYERLDEIKEAAPWSFTIGGAFFEHRFGDGISEQIDNVCRYMSSGATA